MDSHPVLLIRTMRRGVSTGSVILLFLFPIHRRRSILPRSFPSAPSFLFESSPRFPIRTPLLCLSVPYPRVLPVIRLTTQSLSASGPLSLALPVSVALPSYLRLKPIWVFLHAGTTPPLTATPPGRFINGHPLPSSFSSGDTGALEAWNSSILLGALLIFAHPITELIPPGAASFHLHIQHCTPYTALLAAWPKMQLWRFCAGWQIVDILAVFHIRRPSLSLLIASPSFPLPLFRIMPSIPLHSPPFLPTRMVRNHLIKR